MKYKEVQNQSISELYDHLYALKKELLSIRIQRSTGEAPKTDKIRKNRRDIARINTHLSQMNKK